MDALDFEAVAAVAGDRPNKVTMDALDSDADAAAAAARDQPNTLTKDAVDFADFDAVVGDLMLKHGVQESDLLERMRNISKAASKDLAEDLPPLQVLYNNCYGAMEKWPGIAKLVKAYPQASHQLREMMELASMVDKLEWTQKTRDAIVLETGKSDGKTKWMSSCLRGREDFSSYAPSALEEICKALNDKKKTLILAIQEKREALVKPAVKGQLQALFASLSKKLPEEIEAAKVLAAGKPLSYMSFTDALTKYGDNHFAVWQNQSHFKEGPMRFLLLYPEHAERLAAEPRSQQEAVDCALKLGLCAASGKHCFLQIAEVPRLAKWIVNEYDGLENVELL